MFIELPSGLMIDPSGVLAALPNLIMFHNGKTIKIDKDDYDELLAYIRARGWIENEAKGELLQ